MKARQLGMSMWGWMFVIVVGCAFAILGMKLVPIYSEYFTLKKMVKATAKEASGGSVGDIRLNFAHRMEIDYIKTVQVEDLDIQKTGQGVRLVLDYEPRVDLFADWTLVGHFHIEEKSGGAE